MIVVFLVSFLGLRNVGIVGNKQEKESVRVEGDGNWYKCFFFALEAGNLSHFSYELVFILIDTIDV